MMAPKDHNHTFKFTSNNWKYNYVTLPAVLVAWQGIGIENGK
jgi:hypothetical protein